MITRETLDRLLDSTVEDDIKIGLSLAYKLWSKEEFVDMIEHRLFKVNVEYPGYLFKAYDQLYVLFGCCILTGLSEYLFRTADKVTIIDL